MGSENSVFQKFELGDPYTQEHSGDGLSKSASTDDLQCTIFPAIRKKDGKPVTLLKLGRQKEVELCKEEVLIEVLKTIRHPNIIKFLDLFECSRSYWLITEQAVPLTQIIENLEDDELICGLYDIMKSVIFLHSRCHMTHNNVKLSSVFVSSSGKVWKLGAMEKVCSIQKSPELVSEDIKMFAKFAISILDLVQEPDFSVRALAKKLDLDLVQSQKPLNIMHIEALLNEDVFRTPFREISSFLDDITVKTKGEKDLFFQSLHSRLRKMNQEVLLKRLASQLFSPFVMAEPSAEKFFLGHLFKYSADSSTVPDDSVFGGQGFKEYCLPIITELLRSRDKHTRLVMLKFLPAYIRAFAKEDLKSDVLPEVLVGLKDLNDEIIAATFCALSHLVPLLGGDIVVGGDRSKHFIDGRPKFDRHNDGIGVAGNDGIGIPVNDSTDIAGTQLKDCLEKNNRVPTPTLMVDQPLSSPLQKKQQREPRRQERASNKEKSPLRSLLGVEKVARATDKMKTDGKDSETEWEEYEASSAASEEEINEPVPNSKERPTATVQPVCKFEGRPGIDRNNSIADEGDEPGCSKIKVCPRPHGSAMRLKDFVLDSNRLISKEIHAPALVKESLAGTDDDARDEFEDNDFSWTDTFDPIEFETAESPEPTINSSSGLVPSIPPAKANVKPTLPASSETTKAVKKFDKLGGEFEVEVKIVKKEEQDFFADMEPDFKKPSASVIVPRISNDTGGSKFSVLSQPNNEETSAGWEENGWEDFG